MTWKSRLAARVLVAFLFGFVQPLLIVLALGNANQFFGAGVFCGIILGFFVCIMSDVILSYENTRLTASIVSLFIAPILGVYIAKPGPIAFQVAIAVLCLAVWLGFSIWGERAKNSSDPIGDA